MKTMKSYQGIAKRYRPQKFSDVVEQDAIIQTLKNALKFERVGHAYLFCGTRGTGKTTLARLLAKAVNCENRSDTQEPCGTCPSCTEIVSGHSLDVIEIDGASNRGIDDIRNLNETVGYASSTGKYKIYIIDEVHMLTKEAFNALLKTLEEPPEHVIFFFATTEPHKVLPTITSRCQRFDLRRISPDLIVSKLEKIVKDLNMEVETDALKLVASHAEGSMRDAESFLDQLLCFEEGPITHEAAIKMLGLVPRDIFFELDKAASEQDLLFPFELAEKVFKEGCHLEHFLDSLGEHYRQVLLSKLGKDLSSSLTQDEMKKYGGTAKLYTGEQLLEILSRLKSELEQVQKSTFKRIDLEILLLEVIRSMKKMPLESLVDRLTELKEATMQKQEDPKTITSPVVEPVALETPTQDQAPVPSPVPTPENTPPVEPEAEIKNEASVSPPENVDSLLQKKNKHEKVLQFASVELKGSLRKS